MFNRNNMKNIHKINNEIYITSQEEIKEGNYWLYFCPFNGLDYGDNGNPIVKNNLPETWFLKLHDKHNYKKIILTTDQDLIKDCVQPIDDEFLEWFVKNTSYKEVKVEKTRSYNEIDSPYEYLTIIPKKEKILIIIKNYLEKNPNDRFCQALFNLGITEFADKNNPEAKDYLLRDIYNDSDDKILERMLKSKK